MFEPGPALMYVFVSAAVILAFLIFERRLLGKLWWVALLGLTIFGVSVALPLLLYVREAQRLEVN